MSRRVFVDNLGPATTQEALKELFKGMGKVESAVIPLRPESTNSLITHGFVVMSSETEASGAIRALNNTDWNGLKLTVTHAGPVTKLRSGFGGAHTISEHKNRK